MYKTTHTIDKVNTNWLFTTAEPVNTLTEEDSLWKIETLYNPTYAVSPAELTLGNIAFQINHTYQLTVVATHRTRICFDILTWDKNSYLITAEMANKPVVITIKYTGTETIVTYNGDTERRYTNDEWSIHNLNGLDLAIQDKDAQSETEHPHFFVSIYKQVIDLYDYVADEAHLVASLPTVDSIDENNVDDVLALISQIEALRTAHFTTAQNASATDISAIKQKAQQIAADHVLNLKKLENALPDFDTMWTADKNTKDAAYKALTKYLAYYNVMFTAEEKEACTESEKIAFYREFFKDRTLVTDNAFSESTSSFGVWDQNPTTHWNPNNQQGTITFPQIAFGAFDRVQFYVQCAGGTDAGNIITFGDVQIQGEGVREFIITKKDDGWYVSFAISGQHTGDGVKLSNDIVLGNTALQITFENDGWGWFVIGRETYEDFNTISGTLTAGTTTVHKITYSYQTNAGEQTKTEYYLNNGTLVLPNVSDYTDAVGKHTFLGWFDGDIEYKAGNVITASATLVAKYEVREGDYKNYTVSFIDEDGEELASSQTYHYDVPLVLPADPTKTYQGTGKHYEFVGWFDDNTQYKGGELIKADLELVAKFKLVGDQREQFAVTLTNLDGSDQTVSVYDGEVAELPTVTRDGYVFEGWYKDGNKYDTSAEVTDNITLAAKWLVSNGYKGMVGTFAAATGDGTAVTDSVWVDSRGNAFTKYWEPAYEGNDVWIKVPTTLFATNDALELFVEINNATFTYTCDNVTQNDGYMGSVDIGYKLKVSFYKEGTTWYIKTKQWAREIPAEVISGDVVTTHIWCDSHVTVKVSEIVGYGNVDYVAKAAEAATAIENLAVEATDAQKLSALQTYMRYRLLFTTYEATQNVESAKVTALKTELNGKGALTIVPNSYSQVVTTMPDWSEKVGEAYNPNGNTYSVSLPPIIYGMYDEVTMVLKCNSEAANFTAIYGDNSCGVTMNNTAGWLMFTVSKHDDGNYYMKVWDANSADYFEVVLSNEVVSGQQAFTFNLKVDAWAWCWLGTSSADNTITATVSK